MITIRPAEQRGHADHGWLNAYHTFSFANYYDPRNMGFRALRVINEDRVAPGQGFGMHSHRDMEIVTCVLEGALEHKDSLGNGEVLRPGEMQRMTAGTGIRHSEYNPSDRKPVHLYQIWLEPAQRGLTPGYEQKEFKAEARKNTLCLVASPDQAGGSMLIHQDARIYLSQIEAGARVEHILAAGRAAWIQIMRGSVSVNGQTLNAGDAAAVEDASKIELTSAAGGEIMLFDLA